MIFRMIKFHNCSYVHQNFHNALTHVIQFVFTYCTVMRLYLSKNHYSVLREVWLLLLSLNNEIYWRWSLIIFDSQQVALAYLVSNCMRSVSTGAFSPSLETTLIGREGGGDSGGLGWVRVKGSSTHRSL